MRIGDEITITPAYDGCNGKPVKASVIWIHPERRFYVTEFTGPEPNCNKIRESFAYSYRRGNDG